MLRKILAAAAMALVLVLGALSGASACTIGNASATCGPYYHCDDSVHLQFIVSTDGCSVTGGSIYRKCGDNDPGTFLGTPGPGVNVIEDCMDANPMVCKQWYYYITVTCRCFGEDSETFLRVGPVTCP